MTYAQGHSFHFISKPRCSDTWAWHTGALLALCETKGSRQDFPLLQVGKQALIKVSTPDHSGCKFVHLGPPAAVQQSGAEGFDQKTHTASSHQWKAELQSFQEALTGDKSRCLKFLAGRFAPTQSCLRSYSQRRAGCWGFFWNILLEKHWIFSVRFCWAMLCASNTTISKVRKLQKFGFSLPLGEQRGSIHGTMFQIPPLQRQGVYSAQAQYCYCHTRNFPNKASILSKPHNLHWVFWCVLTSHWEHFQFFPIQLQPIHTPSLFDALHVNFSIFIVDCQNQSIISIHQFADFSSSGWVPSWKEGGLGILNEQRHDDRKQKSG